MEGPLTVPWNILIASSDLIGRRALLKILEKQGLDSLATSTVRECKEIIATGTVGLIFSDPILADGNYRDLLNASRAAKNRPRVVVMSHLSDWDEYLNAMRLGAFDVIAAPCRPTDVEWMVIQALRYENSRLLQMIPVQGNVA
jgi:DNA-binding NtrC family response regulator